MKKQHKILITVELTEENVYNIHLEQTLSGQFGDMELLNRTKGIAMQIVTKMMDATEQMILDQHAKDN